MHLTTLSPPALLGDLLLVWLCHKATITWGDASHARAMMALGLWMFTSKWIKLLGHYIRYPVDVLLMPVSIIFGYFHGAIKMYAVMTLNVVSYFILFYFILLFLLLSPQSTRICGCGSVAPMYCLSVSPSSLVLARGKSSYDMLASQTL